MQDGGFRGTFTPLQTQQLLAPIRANRVLKDPRQNNHVSQQDVTAHLIRVFGFGNFATDLLDLQLVFETMRPGATEQQTQRNQQRYDVCYRATMRVSIYDEHHNFVTSYENASTGDAQNSTRADAHDLALKSAISLAMKRCCINLGDQFGLSLYNRGQMEALVRGSVVLPQPALVVAGQERADLQEGVPQQTSMGVDEIEKNPEVTEEQEKILADTLGAKEVSPEKEPTED